MYVVLGLTSSECMAFTPSVYVDVYMAFMPSQYEYVGMAITPSELSCVDGIYAL